MNFPRLAFPVRPCLPHVASRALQLGSIILFVLLLALCPAQASGNADDDYVSICFSIQNADNLAQRGSSDLARAKYIEARQALAEFQRSYPNWNDQIVNFRLNYLAEKIADATAKPAAAEPTGASAVSTGQPAVVAKSPVKLLDAGSEPRTAIRLHPAVGDKQTLTLTMKMGMDMSAMNKGVPAMDIPAIAIAMVAEVKNIASNGDITYELTYDDATVATDSNTVPAIASAMKLSLGSIRGLNGTGRLSDRGLLLGMQMKLPPGADPQISQVMDQMKDSFSSSSTPFPDEAIGTGAKWEYKTKIKSQGMTLDQTIASELVSADGDHVTVRNTITQNAAHQKIQNPTMPGLKLDLTKMTGQGSGDSTFDLAHILPVAATLNEKLEMAMAMDMGQQKQAMDMKMSFAITIASK